MMRNDNKIKSFEKNLRITLAIFLTTAFHMIFLIFSVRESSAIPSAQFSRNAFIIDENSENLEIFSEIIKCGNPALFLLPDNSSGFSSILNKKNSLAKVSIKNNIDLSTNLNFKRQREKMFSFQNTDFFMPYSKDYLLANLSPPSLFIKEKDYPLVFDQYGRAIKKLSEKFRNLNFSSAKFPSEFEITQNNPDRLPFIKVKTSSGDPELDSEAKKILIQSLQYIISEYKDKYIILTIYWNQETTYDKS